MSINIPLQEDIMMSNKLNVSGDISCRDINNSGGRILAGVQIERTKDGKPGFLYGSCATVRPKKKIYKMREDQYLDQYCDCQLVDVENGRATCPNGTALSTYYPLLNKASCCSPCFDGGKIKASFPSTNCQMITKDVKENDISCPAGQYAKSFEINNLLSKIECCTPDMTGEYLEKHNQLMNSCKLMGMAEEEMMEECDPVEVEKLKSDCNKYGILETECTKNKVLDVQAKCDQYGMRYWDPPTNSYKNPDSYINCHQGNFQKMDDECARKDIKVCNFENLKGYNYESLKELKNKLLNMDNIKKFINGEIKKVEKMVSFSNIILFTMISLLSLIIIIVAVVYLFRGRKKTNV